MSEICNLQYVEHGPTELQFWLSEEFVYAKRAIFQRCALAE